ncbi:MAG: DUF4347 domain-containing protein [Okeania sp. SIO3I5]|uniref:DUF4347 domain-containing protein n=1 Tax=Okeania sp. SIO3I5 TaxID=2607805 RepID=UPI0013B5CF41|nr:DUF4347 domain-containing protein [Okeania sp. SIO3I5]NEQ41149.1 DUF4347 domain-containing protein [Okeania sp. SIO3I5]
MNQQSYYLIPYSQKARTIVFIDKGVENYQMLVAGAIDQTNTIILESNRDGIKQITEVLAQRSNINAIHIISHGSPGCLYLGNTQLSLDTINNYIWDLQQWEGDLFLYGCNVAAGDAGAEFLQRLQKITSANIAASANLTGSAVLGGDWQLEVKLGEIESTGVFGEAIATNYNSVFAINRVSVDSSGNEANGVSTSPAISSDGRFVAFSSVADNLVSGDTNDAQDVFVHDRQTGITSLVSVNSAGEVGNALSGTPSISGDGRFIAFSSTADNLVPEDTNEARDIFVHDRQTGITSLVSVNSAGELGNTDSQFPIISADGSEIFFNSNADNLLPGDTNEKQNIFIRELETGITTQFNPDSSGNQFNSSSRIYSMSGNGRFITFSSDADNLIPGEENCQMYIHDRETGINSCLTAESHPGDRIGDNTISNDGRFIAFESVFSPFVSMYIAGDSRPFSRVFVYDRATGETNRIRGSQRPVVSADGRFIASTTGTIISPQNGKVFIHDLRSNMTTNPLTFEDSETQRTQSFSPPEPPRGWEPEFASISADGSLIAFNSLLGDLVPGDTENLSDVFVVENLLANEEVIDVAPFQPLVGTAEDDILVDIDAQDSIFGLEGDDTIDGGSGADVIFGNQGFDSIDGNFNSDTIYGGKDNDRILGNGGNDLLLGERDNDNLQGEDGNDSLFGGKGGDRLDGGTGSDRLSGDLGDDILVGSKGNNTLIGGPGEDVFSLAPDTGNNTILDFEDGIDRIGLREDLGFSEIALVTGEDNTISIVVTRTEEIIGTIIGVDETAITSDDFIFTEGF